MMGVWWKDESAFKVGDRVRLKGHPYESFSSNVGVIVDRAQSHKRGDWDVLADDSEDAFSFREDEMELLPADSGGKFKIGDRVRATADAPRGEVGTIRDFEPGDSTQPFLVEFDTWRGGHDGDGGFTGGRGWWLADGEMELLPTKATAALKIEAGKYYRTRDGRKVGPMVPFSALGGYPWTDGRLTWTESGAWHSDVEDEGDLIAEWTDTPCGCAAAEVDNLRDEYGPLGAKPKFKVGDRVENAIPGNDYETPGTVTKIVDGAYRVQWDDEGWLDRTLEWHDHELRLVAPATSGKSIVCRLDNGKPKPSTNPYVHPDRAAAIAEAERLARTNPGKEFGVYELVGTRKEESQHAWQKLALAGKRQDAIAALRAMSGIGEWEASTAVHNLRAA